MDGAIPSAEPKLDVQELIDAGLQCRRANRRPEALAFFHRALELKPDNSWACAEVANEMAAAGQLAEADELLRSTISLLTERNYKRAYIQVLVVHRALIASDNGQRDAADVLFREAIEFLPDAPRIYSHFSRHLRADGRINQAVDVLLEGLHRVAPAAGRETLLEEYAICAGLQAASGFTPRTPSSTGSPGVRNAAIVMLVKDEADIIFENLHHHYGLGFRRFVLCDNASTDLTRAEIQRFGAVVPDAELMVLSDPVREYIQDLKTFALATVAASFLGSHDQKVEWIFPLDADEFITLPAALMDRGAGALLELAEKGGASVISMFLCNATSPAPIQELPPFRRWAEVLTLVAGFAARPVQKVAFRYRPDAKPHMGNHFVSGAATEANDILIAAKHGIHLTHYPYRSLAHVRKKIINGGRAFEGVSNLRGGAHWRTHYAMYQQRGEQYVTEMLKSYMKEVAAAAVNQPLDAGP